ncbi:hypothetical protein [Paenibacillus sp. NPDC057934]|uniref:hypothetical protein n=1 Tax=Paenibacillus sp. NPDC057934 TaxID=3346282 RepID=UPI0036DF3BDC
MLRACIILGKTQREVENDYYQIDIPRLLQIKDQVRAGELLQYLDVISLPHIIDDKAREEVLSRITAALPKPPPEPVKSAEEQYQANLARMKGGR